MRPVPKAALYGAFALFLAAFAVWGVRNPRLKIDSDPSTYLRFAEALARGGYSIDYPPDRVFAGHYPPGAIYKGTYTTIIEGGRGIAFYSIGYPLYLAPFIALFGIYGAFFANLLVWIALLVLLWAVTRRVFAGHPAGEAAALAAPALYWIWNREEVTYLLAPYRDPLAHALLLGAALCLLEHVRRERPRLLLLGGLLFGYSVAVRETSILAAVPLGLFWLRQAVAERRPPRASALAAAALGALLGVAPLLAQNWANTGSPFYPTQVLDAQVRMGNISDAGSERQFGMRGLKLEHFRTTEPLLVGKLLKDFDPTYTALIALGVAAGLRTPGVTWLLLPFIVVFTAFFGLWVKPMMRYVLVAQAAAVPLAAFGAAVVASLAARGLRRPRLPEALAALLLVATGATLLARREPPGFGIAQAEAFRRDLEASVPAGGIVIAERPMRDVIDHLTHAHAVRPEDVVRLDRGLTFAVASRALLREAPGLWFLDSADGDRLDRYDDTPTTRELILDDYDLEPVARLEAARYGARELFGAGRATLWRLVPWSHRTVSASIAVPAGEGAILRVDARDLAAPVAADVRLDGRPLAARLLPGWNWLPLPGREAGGTAQLVVAAAAPIPADLAPRVFAAGEPIVLEAGPAAIPLDARFLSREFLLAGDALGQRGIASGGTVRVPVPTLPGATAMLVARLRGVADDGVLPVRFAAPAGIADRTVRGRIWTSVALPLGDLPPGGLTAAVSLEILPGGPAARGPLGLDRVSVLQLWDQPLPLRVDFGAPGDAAVAAAGFYEPEWYLGKHSVRATDGAALAYLPLAAAVAGAPAHLAVAVHGLPAVAGPSVVRLALNGQPLGEFPLAADASQEISCAVPAGLLRHGLNELAIAGSTWRPAQFGAVDARLLGVLVDEVRLEPPGGAGRGREGIE